MLFLMKNKLDIPESTTTISRFRVFFNKNYPELPDLVQLLPVPLTVHQTERMSFPQYLVDYMTQFPCRYPVIHCRQSQCDRPKDGSTLRMKRTDDGRTDMFLFDGGLVTVDRLG